MAKEFTLGKKERLKSRKLIEQLFKEGKSFVLTPFRVHFMKSKPEDDVSKKNSLKFGVGVSTKNFKKAVDRNRIKRLTREAYRLQKKFLEEKLMDNNNLLNVFIIYTSKELPVYNELYKKIGLVLSKLDRLTEE